MQIMMVEPGSQYHPPPLALFFHALPHVNISLHPVNSTFDLDSEVYLESLGILGSIPAAWLIITLFLLLVYLCTRCCDRKPRPKHSIVILKWTLAVFTLLCCGAVGVGLYGNDDVHNGMLELLTAGKAIDDIIGSVKNQTSTVETILSLKVKPLLVELSEVFEDEVANATARDELLQAKENMATNVTAALNSLHEIDRPLKLVNLGPSITYLSIIECIRWPITMAVLSILLVFCVILLFGVARHSRCALITFSVFGLFAVIFSWLMASAYLTAAVALGDVCVEPSQAVARGAAFHRHMVSYYTTCESTRTNPFSMMVRRASTAVDTASYGLARVARLARSLYPPSQLHPKLDVLSKEMKLAHSMVSTLAPMLDCTPIHKEYKHALHALCDTALFGLTFMLAASIGAGFFFAVLVWLDSHTWIYIRKKRDYLQVEEQDPYLPPTAASQAIAARSLQGSYDSSCNHNLEHLLPPPSAPPSYFQSTHHYQGVGGGGGPGGVRDRCGGGQYATLNRKFRTLEHPSTAARRNHPANNNGMVGGRRNEPGNSYTLGSRSKAHRQDGPGQYNTLSKKCKTLESSDFY